MICHVCATANEPDRRFCKACAAPLAVICSICAASNAPDSRFCGQCAAPLVGDTAAPPVIGAGTSGSAVLAERRLVSVLFADLVGFTPFAETHDAEEVRETLTRYFEIAANVIGRYGGTVEKFIGDAVMAVWGANSAHEDDPERAVRAALELIVAVQAVGPGIQARAGVLTGEAAVTVGATNQGMVAGDLVNTAARLQAAAPAGAVLVGEATRRAAGGAIAFEPAGEHELKGKASPVPAFRALRVVAEVGGRNRSETLEAPFVGRDEELRQVKEQFHATGREGRSRLLSILGPGGIGKSRLAWEFLKYVDGLVETVWWHAGRCPAYGEGITFWALGEIVRERAGLAETDDEATTRERIATTVNEWIADPDEREWVESALLALLGVQTAETASEQLFPAWRTFFERIAEKGTVAMVFEDLQWADSGLLDFIEHVLQWSRNVPIFVVTLARPELLERRPEWGARQRSFTSLVLEPLPLPAMRALLDGLVPGLAVEAVEAIVARAEGIPLYAIETVRMLVADGRLVATDGGFQPRGDLATVAVPDTLTALIAARLDGLDPADRSLLCDAAVLGQSFTLAALAAVAGRDAGELEKSLRALVRREMLMVQADPRSPERGQYVFVQALIREVAYHTLAHRDRRSRHLAAARQFESLGTDEIAGVLAGHYLAAFAHSAPGPEAEAVGGQARIALRAAADRAAGLGSHAQAVDFLAQALTVTTQPSEEADLLERAGESASAAGRHDKAETFLRRAVELRRRLGDDPATAGAIAALGRALLGGYRIDAAILVLESAVEEFAVPRDDPAVIAVGGQLARAFALNAMAQRALEVSEQVLPVAERADLVAIVADVLITKGGALSDLGRGYEGIGALKAGLAIAESNDLPIVVLRALSNLCATQIARDPAAGLAAARSGLAEAWRLSLPSWIASLTGNGVEAAFWTGDWDWAVAEAGRALGIVFEVDRGFVMTAALPLKSWRGESVNEEMEELQRIVIDLEDPDTLSTVESTRSYIALGAGDLPEARELSVARARRSPLHAPSAYPVAARASIWMRDVEGARENLALLEASANHGPAITLYRATIGAGIAALEGRPEDALMTYRSVLPRWRDLGCPVLEAMTAIDMAAVLDLAHPDVQTAIAQAREVFSGIGAVAFLARLDAAVGESSAAPVSSSTPVREPVYE